MKKIEDTCPSSSCSGGCSVTALALVRIGIGAFFLAFGIMKLMNLDGIMAMMSGLFGFEGMMLMIVTWVVVLTELVGGVIVLAGSLLTRCPYMIALMGFLVIDIVGFGSAHWLMSEKGFDMMQFFWHAELLLMIIALMVSRPKCPMGITGSKS